MPKWLACFGCGGPQPFVDHTDQSRDELKKLYQTSIDLNRGRLIVHGIFARANTKNNNKRVYPKHILKREVTKYEQEHIRKGSALGELDHPNYASRYFKCLNLPNISHQVLEVNWRGDELWGTIEILPTPSGLLLWELYSQGIKLGVSSRGWASLRTDPRSNCVYVDDDFELITFDFVTEPSTKGAFLIPTSQQYAQPIPAQAKAVQTAHLGHGVVSMRNIQHLPDVPTMAARIQQLQASQAAATGQVQGPATWSGAGLAPPAACVVQPGPGLSRAHVLDQLLLYSHYLVFPQATYLDREQHARDFQSHLAMFATRAHLADQQHLVSRSNLNAIILKEIAKEEAEAAKQQQVVKESEVEAQAAGSWGHSKAAGLCSGMDINDPSAAYIQGSDTLGHVIGVIPASVQPDLPASGGLGLRPSDSSRRLEAVGQQGSGSLEPPPILAAGTYTEAPVDDLQSWALHPHACSSPREEVLAPRSSRPASSQQEGSQQGGEQQLGGSSTCSNSGSGAGAYQPLVAALGSQSRSRPASSEQAVRSRTDLSAGSGAAPAGSLPQAWQVGPAPAPTQPVAALTPGLASQSSRQAARLGGIGSGTASAAVACSASATTEAEVAAEFQRIKATLAVFGAKCVAARGSVMAAFDVQLPVQQMALPALAPSLAAKA